MGVIWSGSCPSWNVSRWELSGVEVDRGGRFPGESYAGRNCPVDSYPFKPPVEMI